MENLVQLIQEEKWTEISKNYFDHNNSLDLIIEAVKEVEKEYILMKDKLCLVEWQLDESIKEEKEMRWLNQFKDYGDE